MYTVKDAIWQNGRIWGKKWEREKVGLAITHGVETVGIPPDTSIL
jgi:hypothetical protein